MNTSNQHVVEFWPSPASEYEVRVGAQPHTVHCATEDEAAALEAQFHGIGWAARAVMLTVQRSFPTAGQTRIQRVA